MKIKLAKSELIHFVGIGGIGMSGLALIMKELGFKVQGSDISNKKKLKYIQDIKNKILTNQLSWLYHLQLKKIILNCNLQKKEKYQFIKGEICWPMQFL